MSRWVDLGDALFDAERVVSVDVVIPYHEPKTPLTNVTLSIKGSGMVRVSSKVVVDEVIQKIKEALS